MFPTTFCFTENQPIPNEIIRKDIMYFVKEPRLATFIAPSRKVPRLIEGHLTFIDHYTINLGETRGFIAAWNRTSHYLRRIVRRGRASETDASKYVA